LRYSFSTIFAGIDTMPAFRKAAFVAALLIPIAAGGFILQSSAATQQGSAVLGQVMRIISDRYVDTLGQDAVYEKAARGLVRELNDPYSELLSPKDLKQFNSRTGGRYAGLGMLIEDQQGNITVTKVYPNTPAERAGVREGDRIIKVDTTSTRGWSTGQVSDYLVGTEGTKVKASFARPGVESPIELQFTRAIIHVPAVPYALTFGSSVGYVPLQTFNENSTEETAAAIKMLTDSGAKGIILDLRGNPGGILNQSISVANLFLKRGQEVASVRARSGEAEHYVAENEPSIPATPLIVLTDEFSASASEIVSGALQDHDRALVLGETTFGKGLVQSVYNLPGGYALKLTTAKWFTPSGRSIQRERKVVDGRLVETPPDTNETEASKSKRPAFKSDAGRTVYGGGGVTPDLIVPDDTLTTGEQQFVRAMAPKNQEFYLVLYEYGLELSKRVSGEIKAQPEWRDEFFNRLRARGAISDRKLYDGAQRYLDRQLEQRVIRFAVGDSAAKRRDLQYDAPLRKAIGLIETGKSQRDLFAAASTVRKQ
jgi:carboxyl-terminal processing protease